MTEALRYNEGKTRFDLIILQDIVDSIRHVKQYTHIQELAIDVLDCVAEFQLTKNIDSLTEAQSLLHEYWYECANVFEYGSKKYSDWNWIKGMKWSYYIASLSRHLMTIIHHNELNDNESGYHHLAHALCNLVMLKHNILHFTDYDDIPIFHN